MRLTLPLTGTVIEENPLGGDPNDPVRPIDIDLGNVSWVMENIDLENEVMVIEVSPAEVISDPELGSRKATAEEKQGFLKYAQELIKKHTRDELYQMSKCTRLKKELQ